MKALLTQELVQDHGAKTLVVAVYEDAVLAPSVEIMDQLWQGAVVAAFESGMIKGQVGQVFALHRSQKKGQLQTLVLVGLGKKGQTSPAGYIKALQAASATLKSLNATEAAIFLAQLPVVDRDEAWRVNQVAKWFTQGNYRFEQCKSKKAEQPELQTLWIHGAKTFESALAEGVAVSYGMDVMKDLANLPGNICTPTYLAEEATKLVGKYSKITVKVIDESELKQMGAGAFVAISQGSAQPGKLIAIYYQGAGKDKAPIALIGKGITFDTGGISIKPGASMDEMKFDMSGAASVMGALNTVAQMDWPVNVVGIIAAAENMPSGDAIKPGDIVTSLSGQTIEILNTDAEGRMVLCDAITYCIKEYEPELMIDIATLTGACMVALGEVYSGLFTEDEVLARTLTEAGQSVVDLIWRLPIDDAYQEQLDSNFADIANIGGRFAGATLAACFLARFTKGQRWAHLDVAGTANLTGKAKGSTGRPVALLVEAVKRLGLGGS